MAGLSDLRDAVAATLKSLLPAGVSIDTHGGTFDLEELKRIALVAPAVRIAVVGSRHDRRWQDGRWLVAVHFAAVIITKDTVAGAQKLARDAAALQIATAVEIAIAGNRFGIDGVFPPENVELRNEYSGAIDKLGVALLQTTWSSPMLIGAPAGAAVDVTIAALTQGIVDGTIEWTASGGITGMAS